MGPWIDDYYYVQQKGNEKKKGGERRRAINTPTHFHLPPHVLSPLPHKIRITVPTPPHPNLSIQLLKQLLLITLFI